MKKYIHKPRDDRLPITGQNYNIISSENAYKSACHSEFLLKYQRQILL